MKLFFIVGLFIVSSVLAKPPENAASYVCPENKSKKSEDLKPVLLHKTHDNLVIGLCGVKETEGGNFSDFDIYAFPEPKKPIHSNHLKNRRVLVIEKKDGMMLIEKIKVDQEYVELFKREISCGPSKCELEKEICIVVNKVKQKWIFKNVKDSKIKSKMKKLGCT